MCHIFLIAERYRIVCPVYKKINLYWAIYDTWMMTEMNHQPTNKEKLKKSSHGEPTNGKARLEMANLQLTHISTKSFTHQSNWK